MGTYAYVHTLILYMYVCIYVYIYKGFPGGSVVKNPPAKHETWVRSLCLEHPPEKEMATHSNGLAWEVPWTEESGGLQSMGLESQRRLSTLPLVIFLSSWHIVIVQRALSHSLNYSEILPICFFSSLFLQCSDI